MINESNTGGIAGAGMGGFMMGMLWGVLIGGVVALLFAPQTGNQTREMIKNRASQIGNAFRGTAKDVEETSEKTMEQMRQASREMRSST
jgi:gas vesicle protein